MFAMSSISEGYSIALLEACACALPIAATRVGGNAEIVADDVNCLVVPPSDPEALADAIGQLLGDPGRASTMGRAGRSRSEEHTSELQSLMSISYAAFCLKKQTKSTLL